MFNFINKLIYYNDVVQPGEYWWFHGFPVPIQLVRIEGYKYFSIKNWQFQIPASYYDNEANEWVNDDWVKYSRLNKKLALNEEFNTLKQVAQFLGFNMPGLKVRDLNTDKIKPIPDLQIYYYQSHDMLTIGSVCIYEKGKWTKII